MMMDLNSLPVAAPDAICLNCLRTLNDAGKGFIFIVGKDGSLEGVFTDGDLRRIMTSNGYSILSDKMLNLVTSNPRSIGETETLRKALDLMNTEPRVAFLAVTRCKQLVGAISRHDILNYTVE